MIDGRWNSIIPRDENPGNFLGFKIVNIGECLPFQPFILFIDD